MLRKLPLIFLALLTTSGNVKANQVEPVIRVAVLENQSEVNIGLVEEGKLEAFDSKTNKIYEGRNVLIIPSLKGVLINNKTTASDSVRIEATGVNFFNIGSRNFRGTLRVIKTGNFLQVINHIPLELYITGLINSEIASSWPKESIKAQAVAARTYALNQIEQTRQKNPSANYDIKSTVMDQVYAGAHLEDIKSYDTVKNTSGEILKQNGKTLPAFYHSCCGGRTEYAHNVWGDSLETPAIEDKFCDGSPKRGWFLKLSENEFKKTLASNNIKIKKISSITTVPFIDSPRISILLIETDDDIVEIKATKLRQILGYMVFRSTWFEAEKKGPDIIFKGRGYGHGVGMCQWGAKGMAEAGHSYKEILEFYYPGSEIVKAY